MISTKLIAHRGWRSHYPENTAIAIQKALDIGARYIEIDVQLTADQIPYLCHDQTLERLCGRSLNINRLPASQLHTLSVYEPSRLGQQFANTPFCSLRKCVQLLSTDPNVSLFVEIKEQSIKVFGLDICLSAILPVLTPIVERCIIISFNVDILEQAKQAGIKRLAPVLKTWSQAFEQRIVDLSPEWVFCDKNLLTGKKKPADLPFASAFYEIGSYQQAIELRRQGADLIETFQVGELITEDQSHRQSSQ